MSADKETGRVEWSDFARSTRVADVAFGIVADGREGEVSLSGPSVDSGSSEGGVSCCDASSEVSDSDSAGESDLESLSSADVLDGESRVFVSLLLVDCDGDAEELDDELSESAGAAAAGGAPWKTAAPRPTMNAAALSLGIQMLCMAPFPIDVPGSQTLGMKPWIGLAQRMLIAATTVLDSYSGQL